MDVEMKDASLEDVEGLQQQADLQKLQELYKKLDELHNENNGANREPTGNPDDKKHFDPRLYVKNTSILKENEYVLIKLPSSGSKIVELKKDKIVSLGKFGNFEVNQVLGHKFGQTFEVLGDNNVRPVDGKELLNDLSTIDKNDEENNEENNSDEVEEENDDKLVEELQSSDDKTNNDKADILKHLLKYSEDNSNLNDIGAKVQQLTSAEIETMKKQSYSSETGKKIIESIINKHGNFHKKTKYSQVKYLKRKAEKYARYFIVEYLSAEELLNFYVDNKDLRKLLDISEETVAFMLNLGNIRPGGRYIIVDESYGLMTYCMLERMNGQGEILIVSENEHVNLTALERYSNYPSSYLSKMVKRINWLQLVSPINEILNTDEAVTFFSPLAEGEKLMELPKNKRTQYFRKLTNYKSLVDVLITLQRGNFDALVVVSTLYIPSVLDTLVPKVGGSRAVVVYSQYKELLVETFQHITRGKCPILAPSIHEIKARNYQAVPGKMHPVMTMRGGGGYVLWGTRVFPLEKVTAMGKATKKKKQKVEPTDDTKVESV